jgi:hypothetical protein
MTFDPSGEVYLQPRGVTHDPFDGRRHPGTWPRAFFVRTDADHLLVFVLNRPPYTWGETPNWEKLSLRVAFEGTECVLTETEGKHAGQRTRWRRPSRRK